MYPRCRSCTFAFDWCHDNAIKYTHLVTDTFLDEVCSFQLEGLYVGKLWNTTLQIFLAKEAHSPTNQRSSQTDPKYAQMTKAALKWWIFNIVIIASPNVSFFSCPGQLNRWPCHSLSEWVSEWVRDFWFQRLQSITMTKIGDLVTH